MLRKRTGSTQWQLFSFKFFFLLDGQILRCPLELILYLPYFSFIDSLLNMDYQKCLRMYILHLRCSGLLASRNTANILMMYHAARSCSGTDKQKHLDIFLLPGHSSIASSQTMRVEFYLTLKRWTIYNTPRISCWQHLHIYSPHFYCWPFSFM